MKVKEYLRKIYELYAGGGATEASYYPILKDFIEKSFKGFKAIILPSKTAGGFPDMKVVTADGHIVGYIECKLPGTDLESLEENEQLRRYRENFRNFLFTNFLDFRLYTGGELSSSFSLLPFKEFKSEKFKGIDEKGFTEFLKKFLSYSEKPITSPEKLAEALSWRVRTLKGELLREVKSSPAIRNLYEEIRKFIIHTLTEEEFADTIAQSLTYGLLILKLRKGEVKKEEIVVDFPKSLSLIREIFLEVLKVRESGLEWALSEVEQTLNLFDDTKSRLTPDELVTHFYEPFLKSYNPELREVRGVYYTPKEVVSFINRSVEEVLEESFNLKGFKERTLTLLDPAAGTLSFIIDILERLKGELSAEGSGIVKKFFEEVVLKNFYAFELLPAPYVIGHLRLSQFFKDIRIEDKKFQLFLTNALEFDHRYAGYMFSNTWAEEVKRADEVKKSVPIMVIVGNPPYSGISANNLKEIVDFLKNDLKIGDEVCQSYYKVGGMDLKKFTSEVLGSNRVKVWLQDDYVKFIRLAQWKICQNGKGVVGYVTNHSYIDNPTFAGMRESLLKTFDRIYILNLHGNKRKKEPDENVFDIMQGVAVGIFVKDGSREGEFADVYYYSTLEDEGILKRDEKLSFLEENSLKTVNWKRVNPQPPFYFFIPTPDRSVWESSLPVNRVFKEYISGIVTARDKLVIGFTPGEVKRKIEAFINPKYSDDEIRELFKVKDNYSWKLSEAREKLRKELKGKKLDRFIKPILYRPFDVRFIFYHPTVVFRMREDIMKHMISEENLGLVTMNQFSLSEEYSHTFLSRYMVDNRIFSSSKGIAYLFSLYLYNIQRVPNFTDEFKNYLETLKNLYGREPSPEEIFYYIYAVLYSPNYREKFGELLKYEFPRIPFTEERETFEKVSEIGRRLVELHLLKNVSAEPVKLNGTDFKVEKVFYKNSRVFINKTTFFEPIDEEVFKYRIGGYQVLKKWLSDRKGRDLSLNEIDTYREVVNSIRETLKLQERLREIEVC